MDWKSSLEALKAGMPLAEEPEAAAVPDLSAADGQERARLDIILDKKGRKGKAATIIAGFTVDDSHIEEIARRLKQRLGVGGSCRGGEILIQGDKRPEISRALSDMGIKNRVI